MKKFLFSAISLIFSMIFLFCIACGGVNNTGLPKNEDEQFGELIEVDLLDGRIREYLNATTESEQASKLFDMVDIKADRPNLTISWDDVAKDNDGNYTLYISTNSSFTSSYEYQTEETQATGIGICIPGNTYYWKVINSANKTIKTGRFHCLDSQIRYVMIETSSKYKQIANFRDVGGWTTTDGAKISYSKMYRCGFLNDATMFGEEVFREYLGIEHEIDLRSDGRETLIYNDKYDFENPKYIKAPLESIMKNIPSIGVNYADKTKKSFQDIFTTLSNLDNYPIVFHCNGGADRTGFLAFILNGVLGVTFEDCIKDYELTTASTMALDQNILRNRFNINESHDGFTPDTSKDSFGNLYDTFFEIYKKKGELKEDVTFKELCERYLTDLGVTTEQIVNFRDIMLEY